MEYQRNYVEESEAMIQDVTSITSQSAQLSTNQGPPSSSFRHQLSHLMMHHQQPRPGNAREESSRLDYNEASCNQSFVVGHVEEHEQSYPSSTFSELIPIRSQEEQREERERILQQQVQSQQFQLQQNFGQQQYQVGNQYPHLEQEQSSM
jgi:hypothetical protein